jgi:hypothetical protein
MPRRRPKYGLDDAVDFTVRDDNTTDEALGELGGGLQTALLLVDEE